MKKNRIISIVIALLVIVVIQVIKKKSDISIEPKYFAITDTSCVNQFILADTNDSLVFEKYSGWKINGKWEAKAKYIADILTTMKRIEIKSALSGESKAKYEKQIVENGVFVQFSCNDEIISSFWFYENYTDGINSFFLDKKTGELFLVKVPGFYGKLNFQFSTHIGNWRSNQLFHYSPADILKVKVEYSSPNDGYTVDIDSVQTYNLFNYKNEKLYCDPSNIERYFTYFRNISFVEKVNFEEINLVDYLQFYARISIKTKQGDSAQFELLKYPLSIDGEKVNYDLNKVLVKNVVENQYFIAKFVALDLLFKDIQYFK